MSTFAMSHKTGLVSFLVSDGCPEEDWSDEIPMHVACELMRVRKIHVDNDSRTMLHWCWDINGTVYTWHADTNRYEICKSEVEYKRAIRWY